MYYTQFLARKCLQKCCPCLCAVALWRPGFSRFFPLRLWAQNANNLDLASGTEETFQSCKHANVIDWTLLIAVFPTNCCVISVITAAEQEVRMVALPAHWPRHLHESANGDFLSTSEASWKDCVVCEHDIRQLTAVAPIPLPIEYRVHTARQPFSSCSV